MAAGSSRNPIPAQTPLAAPPLQSEVEDLIWEVDEDCDGLVNWAEFQRMWQRCQEDRAGGWDGQVGRWKNGHRPPPASLC